jgi:hypothetical protein
MISNDYNIKEFIEEVKDKEYFEIIDLTIIEAEIAEKSIAGYPGAVKAREKGVGHYARILKGLIFFLRYRIKPGDLYEGEFQFFLPICQNLIQKGIFKQVTLELFDSNY